MTLIMIRLLFSVLKFSDYVRTVACIFLLYLCHQETGTATTALIVLIFIRLEADVYIKRMKEKLNDNRRE